MSNALKPEDHPVQMFMDSSEVVLVRTSTKYMHEYERCIHREELPPKFEDWPKFITLDETTVHIKDYFFNFEKDLGFMVAVRMGICSKCKKLFLHDTRRVITIEFKDAYGEGHHIRKYLDEKI